MGRLSWIIWRGHSNHVNSEEQNPFLRFFEMGRQQPRRPPPTTAGFDDGQWESHIKERERGLETGKSKGTDFP